MQSKKLAFHIL